jgi:hypothetical protein
MGKGCQGCQCLSSAVLAAECLLCPSQPAYHHSAPTVSCQADMVCAVSCCGLQEIQALKTQIRDQSAAARSQQAALAEQTAHTRQLQVRAFSYQHICMCSSFAQRLCFTSYIQPSPRHTAAQLNNVNLLKAGTWNIGALACLLVCACTICLHCCAYTSLGADMCACANTLLCFSPGGERLNGGQAAGCL